MPKVPSGQAPTLDKATSNKTSSSARTRLTASSTAPRKKAPWPQMLSGAIFGLLLFVLLDDIGILWLLPSLRGLPDASLLFLAFGALLGALKREKYLQGLAFASAVFWLVVAFSPLAERLVKPLPLQAPQQEIARGADAVVVLSSSIQDDGDFTSVSLQRLVRGLELIRSGHAPLLVLTELRPPSGSYTAATKTLTEKLKISIPIITHRGPVRDTHDEAVAVARLAKQHGWKRIFLVTSPTHTRRAALTFRHAARGMKLRVLPIASQETDADLQTLDTPGDRMSAFGMAIHEIIGLKIYRRRGWV